MGLAGHERRLLVGGDRAPSRGRRETLVSGELRCVVRHEALPRVEQSTLRYPDEGHVATAYLGGEREVGWQHREHLPSRPATKKREGQPMRTRFARSAASNGGAASHGLDRERLAADIRALLRDQLRPKSVVAVVSKGDERLLDVGAEAWHFPRASDGGYLGYHPPDDAWAIGHLDEVRARGAAYLVVPVTAFWWLEHYRRFADHLDRNYAVVAEHQRMCVVYDMRL